MWKRWTVCVLAGHKWQQVPYPPTPDGQYGHFIRCTRCRHEDHQSASGYTKVVTSPPTHWDDLC